MVLGKKGVSLFKIIVGFIALLVYVMMLPTIDDILNGTVSSLTGITKWVVQLFPLAFLVVIVFYSAKGDGGYREYS